MNNTTKLYKWVLIFICFSPLTLQATNTSDLKLPHLRLGFTSGSLYDVDANDARAAQETWLRSVLNLINESSTQKGEVKSVFYPTVTAACEGFHKNEVDAIIILPIEYLSMCNKESIIPALTSLTDGKYGDHYVLVTRKQDAIQDINELQSTELILSIKGNNTLPKFWLETELLQKGYTSIETFFKKTTTVSKTTQAILPVFFGNADVCLVPQKDLNIAMELNPQLKNKLEIIKQSESFIRTLVCTQKEYYDTYFPLLKKLIEVLNSTPQGQQFLTLFRASRLKQFQPEHLQNINKIAQTYRDVKGVSIFPQHLHNLPIRPNHPTNHNETSAHK